MKLICFDIDGTLVHTDGAGRRAIARALLEVMGTTGPIDQVRFDGRTDGDIVVRLAEGAGIAATPALVSAVLDRYVALLDHELARPGHATRVYPGIGALLEALEAADACMLGLVTGNVEGGARLKLGSAGLAFDRFLVGAFGSDSHVRADLPAVARRRASQLLEREIPGPDVVIIGDTPADMTCGQGIGARAIGTATGSYTAEQLLASGAHAAFADLSDTRSVVQAILGTRA